MLTKKQVLFEVMDIALFHSIHKHPDWFPDPSFPILDQCVGICLVFLQPKVWTSGVLLLSHGSGGMAG